MEVSFKPSGCCAQNIKIELDDDTITRVEFKGGCRGNTLAVGRLVEGQKMETVSTLLRGIPCRGKSSCPDQLALALEKLSAGESLVAE